MADDSFIREVEEELRSDKFKALWKRFGPLIIGAAVLLVAATAAWRGWLAYAESRANASGDRFLEALETAEAGEREEALAMLAALREDGAGRYDLLAAMRAAGLLAADDPRGAADAFAAVANDSGTPPAVADVARLRAAYLLVDHGEPGEVSALVAPLAADGEPMRHSAREALGLAAWRAGDREAAAERFRSIVSDSAAPPGVRARAEEMLAFHRSLGGEAVEAPVESDTPVGADVPAGDVATEATAPDAAAPDAAASDPAAPEAPDAPAPTDG